METAGAKAVLEKLGVDATGQVFNSIVAIEQMKGQGDEPLREPGRHRRHQPRGGRRPPRRSGPGSWPSTRPSRAGSSSVDEEVYRSEAATNERNQAIAKLMHAYGRLYFDPAASTDVYTRQCSISVNASDLAVMAATLANGGRNPVTGKQVISPEQRAAHPRGHGHGRPLRRLGHLALRGRPARQERRGRRASSRWPRGASGSPCSPLPSTRPATACAPRGPSGTSRPRSAPTRTT